jgi:serine/threonine protein kinase
MSRSLAYSPGTLPTRAGVPSDDRLVAALQEYLAALEEGPPPELQSFLARYPDIRDALQEALSALQFVQDAARCLQVEPDAPAAVNQALGDFHIVREIGRGGMGVVYEAVQLSLGRRVALKVLPFAATLDPKQLQRFKNEAQAAAGLHHPGIVPVYSVGLERGVHYYAMQLIEGQTLAALIADLRRRTGLPLLDHASTDPTARADPTSGTGSHPFPDESLRGRGFFRAVALLGQEAAEALEHAHELGVIHRDIKPANLLVDLTGRLWVTDFGLARLSDEAGLTLTGDLVGTMRYMSPEQAAGGRRAPLDHRTDVYSLGATLYELATLRPVFEGQDRQELLHQILAGEPTPPRHHNRTLPRDLETILLKALARDPADRYATARDLADDLGRFANEEPIRARRPGLLERTGRWLRRRRSLVVAAFIVLLLAVAGLSLSTFFIWEAERKAKGSAEDATKAHATTEEQRQRAENNWREAWNTTEGIYQEFALRWLSRDRWPNPAQRREMLIVLNYYDRFLTNNASTNLYGREAILAWARVGCLRYALGDQGDPEAPLTQAINLAEAHFRTNPTDHEIGILLCENYGVRGRLRQILFRDSAGLVDLEKGVSLADALARDFPRVPACRRQPAVSRRDLGTAYLNECRTDDAYKTVRMAYEDTAALLREDPRDTVLQRLFLHLTLYLVGPPLDQQSGPAVEGLCERVLEHLRQYGGPRTDSPGVRLSRLNVALRLGYLERDRGNTARTEALFRLALADALRLVNDDQEDTQYQISVLRTAGQLAHFLRLKGEGFEADGLSRQSVEAGEMLARRDDCDDHTLEAVAQFYEIRIDILRLLNRNDEAEAAIKRLLELRRRLVAAGDWTERRFQSAAALGKYGNFLRGTSRSREARDTLTEALAQLDRLPAGWLDRPEHRSQRRIYAFALGDLADACMGVHENEQAASLYPRALTLRRALLEEDNLTKKERLEHQIQLGRLQTGYAGVLRALNRREEAEKEASAAIPPLTEVLQAEPNQSLAHNQLASVYAVRAILLRERDEDKLALSDLRQARNSARKAVGLQLGNRQYLRTQQAVCQELAVTLQRLGLSPEAALVAKEAKDIQEALAVRP